MIGTTNVAAELTNIAINATVTELFSSAIKGKSLCHAVDSTPFDFSFSASVLVSE